MGPKSNKLQLLPYIILYPVRPAVPDTHLLNISETFSAIKLVPPTDYTSLI